MVEDTRPIRRAGILEDCPRPIRRTQKASIWRLEAPVLTPLIVFPAALAKHSSSHDSAGERFRILLEPCEAVDQERLVGRRPEPCSCVLALAAFLG